MTTMHTPEKAGAPRAAGMKVGELAKRTGLSVRTLHYYDEIGLLQPSQLTESRHRVYGSAELTRLQQIKSLRQLGFSLDEIRACLDMPEFSPARVLDLHLKRLREQLADQQRLVALLETLRLAMRNDDSPTPDDFISAIEGITMVNRSFTVDELAELKERGEQLGWEHVRGVEREWPGLIARVRAELLDGTEATSERMRPLAERWRELVREFTGGNPQIEQKVRAAYVSDPKLMQRNGLDPEIFAYVNAAIRAL